MKTNIITFLMVVFTTINLYGTVKLNHKEVQENIVIQKIQGQLDSKDTSSKKLENIQNLVYPNNERDYFFWIVFAWAILFLAATLFLLREKISGSKIEKDCENKADNYPKESHKLIDLSNHPVIKDWQKKYKELENKLGEKENEIKELNIKINDLLNSPISKVELKNEIVEQKVVDQVIEKSAPVSVPEAPKEIIYYASNIDADGYFDINDLKSSTNNNEFYKITIFNDRSEFEFYNNKYSLQTGLEYINDYIKPFCYETNFQGDNVTSIKTIKKGTLLKEGNRWKVQSKAEIKYE